MSRIYRVIKSDSENSQVNVLCPTGEIFILRILDTSKFPEGMEWNAEEYNDLFKKGSEE